MTDDKERAIRAIVDGCVGGYAAAFSDRHLNEVDDPEGTINMKIHNVFISALGPDIQFYSSLARSLDSSLGNLLERMAISIAKLSYSVSQHVEGVLYSSQTEYIAQLLECYKNTRGLNHKKPEIKDYTVLLDNSHRDGGFHTKRHESDYCLKDEETGIYHLIELKIGGDLDNKKSRSEKEALLEQYCLLGNMLKDPDKVKIHFATAYNRYGEGKPWKQGRVLQFFANEELLISSAFWNFICKSDKGYDVVIDQYRKSAYQIVNALDKIKRAYLND